MEATTKDSAPRLKSIGLDIGKDVLHIVGFGIDGQIVLRRKVKRLALVDTFKKLALGRHPASRVAR